MMVNLLSDAQHVVQTQSVGRLDSFSKVMSTSHTSRSVNSMRGIHVLEGAVGGFFGGGFILTLRDGDPRVIGGYILMAASLTCACIIKATKDITSSFGRRHE
jgi:hypothetical protein